MRWQIMKLQTEKRLKALSPFFPHKGKSVALANTRKVRSDPSSAEHSLAGNRVSVLHCFLTCYLTPSSCAQVTAECSQYLCVKAIKLGKQKLCYL